jgi:predicted CoA-binding protein
LYTTSRASRATLYNEGMPSVVVIGASADRRKFGNKAVRAFVKRGYRVIPVNPHESEVEGLKAFASVTDVPGNVDLATLYVPPSVGRTVLEDVARKGIREVWLNPGAHNPDLVERARALGLTPVVTCSIQIGRAHV